mmetsp:Transcript_23641/g.51868  ORF Transcript_23641/g.51868 Transcript_23641/m.51868 type:complete len:296 (-) Transcript_23641:463-1350(-)
MLHFCLCMLGMGHWHSLCVPGMELLHEVRQRLHTLNGHGVVDGGAHAAHGAVALQLQQPQLVGLLDEGLLQVRVAGDGEGHVHEGAHGGVHGAVVEAPGRLNRVVQHLGLALVQLQLGVQTALLDQLGKDQAADVDAPAGGGVVHGVVVDVDLVVQHGGGAGPGLANQILPDDGNGHTSRADVLLGTRVDDAILGDVHRLGDDVGAHVRNQNLITDVRNALEFHPSNSLIVTVVDILSILAQLPRADCRDGLVVTLGDDIGLGVLLSLLVCLLAPGTGHDIVGHVVLGGQVQGDH